MTRELLLPLLTIAILVNIGVITYVIGRRRAHEPEPLSEGVQGRRAGLRQAASLPVPAAVAPPASGVIAAPSAHVVAPPPRRAVALPILWPARPSGSPGGTWDDMLEREGIQAARSGFSAAVVAVDLVGLDNAPTGPGVDPAERLALRARRALRDATGPGDPIGWDGRGRFRVLIRVTDPPGARAAVDRLTRAVAGTLAGDRSAVTLAVGWGMRTAGGDFRDAARQAERELVLVDPRVMTSS